MAEKPKIFTKIFHRTSKRTYRPPASGGGGFHYNYVAVKLREPVPSSTEGTAMDKFCLRFISNEPVTTVEQLKSFLENLNVKPYELLGIAGSYPFIEFWSYTGDYVRFDIYFPNKDSDVAQAQIGNGFMVMLMNKYSSQTTLAGAYLILLDNIEKISLTNLLDTQDF